jgi:aldehyde:ferredoxin oxidoreductase
MSNLIFRIQEPDQEPREVPVKAGMTIGRDPKNDLVLADPNVSGHHAVVEAMGGGLAIKDLGSSNKTVVVGGPILHANETFPLAAGVNLTLGRCSMSVAPGIDDVGATMLSKKPAPPAAAAPATPAPAPAAAAPTPAPAPAAAAPVAGAEAVPVSAPDFSEDAGTPLGVTFNRYLVSMDGYHASKREVQARDLEDAIGGAARAFKVLEHFDVDDPYAPSAPLILNLGILSGSQFMTGLRTFFHGYSPLKASLEDKPSAMWSAGSGKFGTKLKYLGVDEVVFTGRAEKPVYLRIYENEEGRTCFEFKSAAELVGLRINAKMKHLYAKYPDAHFACIGPAGENYENVAMACIGLSTINQLRSGDMKSRFCGRGGMGGIMGSKNLLAIVADVKDKKDSTKYPDLAPINKEVMRGEGSRRFRDKTKGDGGGGTWANAHALNPLHAMPENNFNPTGTDISVPLYRENVEKRGDLIVKDEACFLCGIACHKNVYEAEQVEGKKPKAGKFLAKLDYEPLNLMSSNIGVFDIHHACHLVDLVDDHGMDSISFGVTLSYAMEYNKRKKEAGEESLIPDWIVYGDHEAAEKVIVETANGRLKAIGQGSKRLSEGLGETAYAMHCKGVEFPAYLPQFNPGYPWSLAGGHMAMKTYLLYVFEKEKGLDYWVDAITTRGLSIIRDDITGVCKFSALPNEMMADAIRILTGLNITADDLDRLIRRTFLRGYKLERKQGFTEADYNMPLEVHNEYPKIDLEHFNTKEFFDQVRTQVCQRFDAMLVEEGI